MSNKDVKENPSRPNNGRHMGRGPGRNAVKEKPKDLKGTTKKLIKRLAEYKIALALVFIFAIGSTIFSIVGPKILGNATTEIFNGLMNKINQTGGMDFAKIGKIILFALALYVLSAVFSIIQSCIMSNVAQKATYKIRKSINRKNK